MRFTLALNKSSYFLDIFAAFFELQLLFNKLFVEHVLNILGIQCELF